MSKNKDKGKSNLFHSKELLKLYNGGQLDVVLDQFSDVINQENFLGGGGDASGFLYKGGKKVLKLCLKKIGYFKRYGHGSKELGLSEAEQFKEHINSYLLKGSKHGLEKGVPHGGLRGESPPNFFVPIEEILYEDENVFIYTQNRCQLLKKDFISPRIVIGVIQMIQFMLRKNILVTDISPHNLGLLKGQVVLFDYHGLHPFQRRDGTIKRRKWCGRILKNLARYLSYIYAPEKIAEYTELMESVDYHAIKKLKSDGLLPHTFIQLAIYVNFGGKDESSDSIAINVDKLFDLLQNIILDILHFFHFQPKQLSRIHCLCNLCIEGHGHGHGIDNHNVDDSDSDSD